MKGTACGRVSPFLGRARNSAFSFSLGFSQCDSSSCHVNYQVSGVSQRMRGLTKDRDA